MKISFVATVFNEEKTINDLLTSLINQTRKPDEAVIVDAGSTDATIPKIKDQKLKTQIKNLKIIIKKGCNRSQGRNLGIKKTKGEIIVLSDAGCELDKNWLKNIVSPFKDADIDVVAGYYQAKSKTIFELCVAPYALVMPDKVDSKNFLPATRSMAIRKKAWREAGGFPEKFSDNEDYVFAQKLKKKKTKVVFCPSAVVYWSPRSNLKVFFMMIYRFARGDAYAGLRYKKVSTVFLRYLLFLVLACSIRTALLVIILAYFFWAAWKNYRYVKHPLAFLYLPVLQITSDLAVILGSLSGALKKI